MKAGPTIKRIQNSLRIDRAFILVWKASKKWTLIAITLTLVQGVFPLATLYIIKLIVDTITQSIQNGIDPSTAVSKVFILVVAAFAVALLQMLTKQLTAYVQEAQTSIVTDYVSQALHSKSISLDLAYYENPQYHDTLHRAQREGPYRPTSIVNGVTKILQNAVSLAAMIGLLFLFHWAAGILLVFSTVPGVIVQLIYSKKKFEWQNKRTPLERKSQYISSVLSTDVFAKEIRLFDLGQFFATTYDSLRSLLRSERLSLSRKKLQLEFFAQLFAILILMSCLLFIAYRTILGLITIGDMVMYYQAFQKGVGFLKNLLTSIASLYEDNMFVAHFFDFLDIQNSIKDPSTPIAAPKKLTSGIKVEGVSFQYPGEREPVLNDVSMEIGAGEIVALVGANGAGKSTLVKLLCRLYDPHDGVIKMDNLPITQFSLKALRKNISVIFQDYAQFFLTARENIGIGNVDMVEDSEKVIAAAGKANAHEFITELPNGYETPLGLWFYSGVELSIGQWQKIALARAFLRKSPFIILDEPTSSLDTQSEYHLFLKFRELLEGSSALLISHRFSTVRMADRIYVLNDGVIAEKGTHHELIVQQGIYADMYQKQASWLEDNRMNKN